MTKQPSIAAKKDEDEGILEVAGVEGDWEFERLLTTEE